MTNVSSGVATYTDLSALNEALGEGAQLAFEEFAHFNSCDKYKKARLFRHGRLL